MRTASLERTTTETAISLTLNLDGTGGAEIATGVGFLDHMLEQLARHAPMDLALRADGDRHVDDHHTVEDCGILLGRALAEAAGDKRGIARYGACLLPMDEALVRVALDLSGRPFLVWDVEFPTARIGGFDTELVREFFQALASAARLTLHVEKLAGKNSHHIAEAAFKGLARALGQALAADPRRGGELPSTKGTL